MAESEDTSFSSWGGQYIGFAIGASKGKAEPTTQVKNTTYFTSAPDPGQLNPIASTDIDATDVNGNLFWGVNGQTDNLVYGVELNLMLNNYDEQQNSGNIAYLSQPTGTFSMSTRVESNWAVSIRPRLGYAFQKSLIYLTAGPAMRQFNYDFTFSDTHTHTSTAVSENEWELGLIVGFGYEFKIQDAWSLRTEYLYSIYRDVIDTQSILSSQPADGFTHKLDFTEHSLSIGLSRKF